MIIDEVLLQLTSLRFAVVLCYCWNVDAEEVREDLVFYKM